MLDRNLVTGGDACMRPRLAVAAHDLHAVLYLPLALVDHRKALDLALARNLGDEVRHLAAIAVGLGLYAGVLRERALRRFTREHQPVMLGNESALAIEQAELAAFTQASHHRDGRMRHIGVDRRAEEGEPAGHGRLHVGTKPDRPPRNLA